MSMARKIRCTVESVTDHGGRVYTVALTPKSPVPPFRPGQFLHLTVDPYDPSSFWPESRVFSIASSPQERKHLRICYSVKGRYTTRMEQSLKPGAEVWIKTPYGEFIVDDQSDAVLLAGGTGISAFTAFIEALKPDHAKRLWLVYGARSPELLLFREMILGQLGKVADFRVLLFAEEGSESLAKELATTPKPPACLPGRISLDTVWTHLPEPAGVVFYISGPPVMLKTLSAQLSERGVPAPQIRRDAWE